MDPNRELFQQIFNSIEFEKIKDHPNILIAANFWEEDRYKAAKTCYKFMRTVDDMIDDHKSSFTTIAAGDKNEFEANVRLWIEAFMASDSNDPMQQELKNTINHFKIPLWPLEAFAKSMIYDIHHDGFETLQSFIDYAGGASVAPASIFVHLCGIQKTNDGYAPPPFNLKDAATPCAVFSYLVHIIRDFQKDQLNNLNYFADDLIAKNGLTLQDLSDMAHGRCPIKPGFRNMIKEYLFVADEYRIKTYEMIQKIRPLVARYQLSLEIIFNLYLKVFERIDVENGQFTMVELIPTPDDTKKWVYETIEKFVS